MAFPRSHLRAMIPALLAGFWMHPGQALAKVEARFAAEQDLATVAAAELATARYRVDAVLPDLGDEALVDQLVALADRKIQVRIVVPAGGPGAKCGPCDRLELHGAECAGPTRASCTASSSSTAPAARRPRACSAASSS